MGLLVFLTAVFGIISKVKSDIVMEKIHKAHGDGDGVLYLYEAKIIFYAMILFVILLNKLVISSFFHYFTDL